MDKKHNVNKKSMVETVAKAMGINLNDIKKEGIRPFYGKIGDTSEFISSKEMELLNTKMKIY